MRLSGSTSIALSFSMTLMFGACGSETDPFVPDAVAGDEEYREIDRPPAVDGSTENGDEGSGEGTGHSGDQGQPDAGYDVGYDTGGDSSGGGSVEPRCGNGILEGLEECDGNQLYVGYCSAFGWIGGDLTCNEHCLLEAAACQTGLCGNGELDPGEECDGGPSRDDASCLLDCRSAGALEVEPNDSLSQATVIDCEPGVECRARGRLDLYDIDLFAIHVDEPVDLLAYVGDGRGGCPYGFDSTLTLYDADEVQLAYDDDSYAGGCSQLAPEITSGAVLGEAGDYYLQVQGYYDDDTGPYTLHVLMTPPVCGDGRVSAGEECDDGDTRIGDGCDAECRYEAIDEIEPNDSPQNANGPFDVLGTDSVLIRGSISSPSDEDHFAVPMGYGDTFSRIDVLPVGADCDFEVEIELIAPDETTVLDSDSYAYDACAGMTETSNPKISNLDEGMHTIVVRSYTGYETGEYLLRLVGRQRICGDGKREGPEMCDDGNDDDTDGCADCMLDADPEVEPNDTLGSAQLLGTFDTDVNLAVAGAIDSGDEDFFEIGLADDARVEAWLSDGSSGCDFDTTLYFYDSTATGTSDYLAYDDDGGDSVCSRLQKSDEAMHGLPAGDYILRVAPWSSGTGYYVLHISIAYPSCGDGIIEGNEICDDGNTTAGDGCSPSCIPEGIAEQEPNDTLPLSAEPFDLTGDDEIFVIGSIFRPAGEPLDVDLFEVVVGDGAQVGALLWNGSGGCRVDSEVTLRSDASTVLRQGVSLNPETEGCWQVGGVEEPYGSGDELSAGSYYLRVAGKGGDMGPYQLVLWADYPE